MNFLSLNIYGCFVYRMLDAGVYVIRSCLFFSSIFLFISDELDLRRGRDTLGCKNGEMAAIDV